MTLYIFVMNIYIQFQGLICFSFRVMLVEEGEEEENSIIAAPYIYDARHYAHPSTVGPA